jgi:hypothetical protein
MTWQNQPNSIHLEPRAQHPVVTSYDSCYEHSVEHWIELRRMVELQNEDSVVTVECEELVGAF